MSENNPFKVFVCHVFQENEDYQRVFEYLESRDKFYYLNYSNPDKEVPASDLDARKADLRNQMKPAEVILVPLGILDQNPELITFQIDAARGLNKPVIGIQAFGQTVQLSPELLAKATEIVEWNERTIVDTIKRLARGEDTNQWEVVEFDPD